jgi:protein TIF31
VSHASDDLLQSDLADTPVRVAVRMQCVDVEFKEKNLTKEDGVEEAYPHRLVLLRPELLEAYRESKLDAWLKEKVKITQEKVAKEQQSIEAELKEAASTDGDKAAEPAKPAAPTTSVINAEDFVLNYNPDAFVERKDSESGKDLVIYDPEDETTQNVRLASRYLREVVLHEFLTEAVAAPFLATDGFLITRTLHRKGINMRYLGLLAAKIETEGDKVELGKATSKEEATFTLELLRQNLLHEMVIRATKHIVNRHLRSAGPYDAAGIVSHLYNCLLGSAYNASPVAETVDLACDTAREWDSVSPASLRDEIRRQVAARFRYTLPETWFEEHMLKNKVLRELSLRVGVQLAARKYDFVASSTADAAAPAPRANGAAPLEAETAVPSSSKKGKKGKKGKNAAPEPVKQKGEPTTFYSADVLSVAPVIKATQHRSALVEDMFYQGQRAIHENQAEIGEALVNDALHLCEQIYGAVHTEAADKYHALGIMWHNIAQRIIRTLRTHEAAEQTLRELPAQEREQYEKQVSELLMPDAEGARAEVEAYLQQAVRLVRQSIVISERTHGVDSADAITQYSDLGLLEQQAGNIAVGLQLTRHAMDLHVFTYGSKHPQLHTLLVSRIHSPRSSAPVTHKRARINRAMRPPWCRRATVSPPRSRCTSRTASSPNSSTAPTRWRSDKPSTSSVRRT